MAAQALGQIPVQFDDRQMPQALDEWLRECCQAGTNLHHALPGLGSNRVNNGFDDGAIGQKMLTESLAGNVLHASASGMPRGFQQMHWIEFPAPRR